jgi:hypothetical protein
LIGEEHLSSFSWREAGSTTVAAAGMAPSTRVGGTAGAGMPLPMPPMALRIPMKPSMGGSSMTGGGTHMGVQQRREVSHQRVAARTGLGSRRLQGAPEHEGARRGELALRGNASPVARVGAQARELASMKVAPAEVTPGDRVGARRREPAPAGGSSRQVGDHADSAQLWLSLAAGPILLP